MSDFHDIGDHYDLGGSHHDAGAHHLGGHYGAHQGGTGQSGQGIMGVLNHFLGNDTHQHEGGDNHSHHNHAGSTNPAHVQTTDSMVGSKWGQFFTGLPVTPSMLFATLFGGMVLWLGVVYFLSHNTNDKVVKAQGTQADQVLLAGMRNAMPVPQRQNYAQYSQSGAAAVTPAPVQDNTLISALPGAIEARPLTQAPVMAQAAPLPYTINPTYQNYQDVRSYSVHVQSPDGTRLKTIVNR